MTGPAAAPRTTARTVDEVRRAVTAEFRAAGIDSPELDARLLIGHALSLDHAALAAAAARVLDAAEENAIASLAGRRLAREPVARIIGMKEFWSLRLHGNAATLVPRPETETVVEAALAAIDARWGRGGPLRLADLGTGSGAILLALLTELPHAVGIGSDLSPQALVVARTNARRLGLNRAAFVACNMAAALRGPFEVIVANPPYLATDEIAALPAEVSLFDPHLALDGGADGLDGYRSIAAGVPSLLTPDGVVVVELGAGQAEAVSALFGDADLAPTDVRPDLSGTARALVASRRHDT